jgi:hypothetical protein
MIPRTKPRGDQLSFTTECVRCRAEISINNGRVDRHDCRERLHMWPQTIHAEHQDVQDGRDLQKVIYARLDQAIGQALNNR